MEQVTMKEIKRGQFFKIKPTDTAPVWVRDDYDRSARKYGAFKFDDVNQYKLFKPDTVVYVGFTF